MLPPRQGSRPVHRAKAPGGNHAKGTGHVALARGKRRRPTRNKPDPGRAEGHRASPAGRPGWPARRSLALHWRERTPQEQAEFVAVFKQLLGHAYIGRLENYSGEQIVYLSENVDGEFATVRSKIVTARGAEIPVDYRLHQVGARWVVYDVAVSGVSFVANYRGQFDKIIRSSSYAALMRDLKAKYAEMTARGAVPAAAPAVAPVAIPAVAPVPKNP